VPPLGGQGQCPHCDTSSSLAHIVIHPQWKSQAVPERNRVPRPWSPALVRRLAQPSKNPCKPEKRQRHRQSKKQCRNCRRMHPNNDSKEIDSGEESCHDVQQSTGYPRQLSKDFFHGLDGARSYAEKVRERRMSKIFFWPNPAVGPA
jgi:hypothetical protein